jgi:hypothetical protein
VLSVSAVELALGAIISLPVGITLAIPAQKINLSIHAARCERTLGACLIDCVCPVILTRATHTRARGDDRPVDATFQRTRVTQRAVEHCVCITDTGVAVLVGGSMVTFRNERAEITLIRPTTITIASAAIVVMPAVRSTHHVTGGTRRPFPAPRAFTRRACLRVCEAVGSTAEVAIAAGITAVTPDAVAAVAVRILRTIATNQRALVTQLPGDFF